MTERQRTSEGEIINNAPRPCLESQIRKHKLECKIGKRNPSLARGAAVCKGAAPAAVLEALSAPKARSSSTKAGLDPFSDPALALRSAFQRKLDLLVSTSSAKHLLEKLQFTVQVDQLLTIQVPETGICMHGERTGRGKVCHSILWRLTCR